MRLNVQSSMIWNSQDIEDNCIPINRWVEEDADTDTAKITQPLKEKNERLWFATMWVELEAITSSEISQMEKDKDRMISLLSGT